MKKLILLIISSLVLIGCSQKENASPVVPETEYITIEPMEYNTDEPLSDLELSIELDLENAYLIKLTNNSDNCYKEIDYKLGDLEGSFQNVAAYSVSYDYLLGRGDLFEITDYCLSDQALYNAEDYITIYHNCNLENHTLGTIEYLDTNYNLYGHFIVLFNHHYIAHASINENGKIESYTSRTDPYADIDTTIYLEMEGDQIKIENPKEGEDYYFAQVELYPEYLVITEN